MFVSSYPVKCPILKFEIFDTSGLPLEAATGAGKIFLKDG
jgi:hypothetical protein